VRDDACSIGGNRAAPTGMPPYLTKSGSCPRSAIMRAAVPRLISFITSDDAENGVIIELSLLYSPIARCGPTNCSRR
jgi:hypothetical protein